MSFSSHFFGSLVSEELYLAGQSDLISQVTVALEAVPHMGWVWSFMKEGGKMRPTGAWLSWVTVFWALLLFASMVPSF